MNSALKQVIFISVISAILGGIRFMLLKDDSFTLIKQPRVLQEASVQVDASGEKTFELPALMTEPQTVLLEFIKYYFDEKKAVIIDARDIEDYEISHIAGAINIPYDTYEDYGDIIDALNYDDVFIIYCSGGECSLSIDLADVLFNEKAFENVFVFEGGLPEWKDAGYPVE
jgi:rhodanese-related sulfurtransferase